MSEEETIEIIEKLQCEYKEQQNDKKYNDYTVFKAKEYSKGLQGLLDLYNKEKEYAMGLYYDVQGLQQDLDKEKEKNKKLEDKIKEATKEMKRRMNLANECIEQEIVIADSDSLNYGRAQAHDVDSVLLKEILE